MNRCGTDPKPAERGQLLVIFAVALTAMIAMVGLVIDGGGTYAQRRFQQNGADLAALAGANAYMNSYFADQNISTATAAATTAATTSATRNGYTTGGSGAQVTVSVVLLASGVEVTVDIGKPHDNAFARVIPGQEQWPVSVTASAVSGLVDTAVGAGPWLMNINAFNGDGTPKYTDANPQDFGEANGDYPVSALDIAWTDFNGNNNVNTSEVRGIIDGSNIVTATFGFDQYLGQHNQGNHTALYSDVDQYLSGKEVPIPIVGLGPCAAPQQAHPDGCFKGWAKFFVISAQGGSSKTITGYFTSDFVGQPLSVGACTPQVVTCGAINPNSPLKGYVIRLTN